MQSLLGSPNQTLVSTFRNMVKTEGMGRLVEVVKLSGATDYRAAADNNVLYVVWFCI